MVDLKSVRLGKKEKRVDRRTLKLANYLSSLPPVPTSVDYSGKVSSWPVYLNDSLGDCTIAAAGHMIEQWTANSGAQATPQDSDILSAYEAITGYTPGNPSTDSGAVELDVLNYWRNTGIAGHKIGAFTEVPPKMTDHVKAAAYLFGGLYIGIQLPVSAQTQGVWDVVSGPDSEPGSWGGHAVEICSLDANALTCITWGQKRRMTWAFWNAYVDEAYAIISQDFMEGNGETPDGFDLEMLTSDLAQCSG
jgi:hypothetical protein